jgi:hypothetical protein
VYTERIMKQLNDSIHWQNIQLYAFGAVCNAVSILSNDAATGFRFGNTLSVDNFFKGYNTATVSSRSCLN